MLSRQFSHPSVSLDLSFEGPKINGVFAGPTHPPGPPTMGRRLPVQWVSKSRYSPPPNGSNPAVELPCFSVTQMPTDSASLSVQVEAWKQRMLPSPKGSVLRHRRQTSARGHPDEAIAEPAIVSGEASFTFTLLHGTGTGVAIGVAAADGSGCVWSLRLSECSLVAATDPRPPGLRQESPRRLPPTTSVKCTVLAIEGSSPPLAHSPHCHMCPGSTLVGCRRCEHGPPGAHVQHWRFDHLRGRPRTTCMRRAALGERLFYR